MIPIVGTLLIYGCSLVACGGALLTPDVNIDPPIASIPRPAGLFAVPFTTDSFAFWYEPWDKDTWDKLQPANVIIGVPLDAVADIHSHGGRALSYVTFYQAKFGSFFLRDANDLGKVCFHTPTGCLSSVFGGNDNYVLCSNSIEVRRRALTYATKTIEQQKFDGLFVDNTYLPPATKLICDGKHPHNHPTENGGAAYVDLLKAVFNSVKRANPVALVIVNPGDPAAFTAESQGMSLWDVSDYVLWESYLYTSSIGPKHIRVSTIARSYELARTASGRIIALSYPVNAAEAFYSYAVASAFGFKYAANLGVRQRGNPVGGGHFGLFAPGLPKLIGSPVDLPPTDGARILIRHYSNGIVMVNTGTADFRTTAEIAGILHSDSAARPVKAGDSLTVPKGQALILLRP